MNLVIGALPLHHAAPIHQFFRDFSEQIEKEAAEADMRFIPTGSPFNYVPGSMSRDGHQTGFVELSKCTPIVFILDEDKAASESLALLISGEGWRPEIFTSAEEFLARPLEFVPSCLLLEVSLPGLSGLELQKRVAGKRPDIPIIFLSAKFDVPTTVQAMKAGAAEFFTKPFSEKELLGSIREALEGSRHAVVRAAENRVLETRFASLSTRERQVMALVVSGLLNKQVGSELGISEITVKAHRGQAMNKMRAKSLPDLVRMAAELRLAKGEMPVVGQHVDRAAKPSDHPFGIYAMAS